MKFKYLGTAAAECWPALFCSCDNCQRAREAGGKNIRTRSQALVGDDLLIDLPPDTYMHAINYGLNLGKIRHIIFTHAHSDHFYPHDLHRTYPPYAHGETDGHIAQIKIYGNETINAHASEFESHGDILNFNVVSPFETFRAGKYSITPLKADHDSSQNCVIYIISDGKSQMLYAHDTGYFPDETWDYLQGAKFDFVSLDATYGMMDSRRGHMGITAGFEVKERFLDMGIANGQTVFCFNHFSHNGKKIYDELVPIAAKMGFLVSFDGMELNI